MKNDKTLRILAMAFSILGLVVSLYLLWIKIYPADPFCTGVGDCAAVNASAYSRVAGVPVALLGALAYAALIALLALENKLPILREWGVTLQFGLALAGTLYSAYLTYIELFVIHQVCPYCVTSAVAITLVCVFSALRLGKGEGEQ